MLGQLNTHSAASLYQAFPPEEAKRLMQRVEIHHTPKHGSSSAPERVLEFGIHPRHAPANAIACSTVGFPFSGSPRCSSQLP